MTAVNKLVDSPSSLLASFIHLIFWGQGQKLQSVELETNNVECKRKAGVGMLYYPNTDKKTKQKTNCKLFSLNY